MTRTYDQIQKKIAALQREAESLRNKEVDGVVARIKVAIEHYGLTAEQLGFGTQAGSARRGKAQNAIAASSPAARYTDGNGKTWSGRGPRPGWLKEALANGKSLEDLSIAANPAKAKSSSPKSSPKKRKAKQSYKDDAGHFWSGFGPQPGWLKEAIASGRSLEEFVA
ncbi:H-NS family nucleoid-associated regulatory protein [Variovorax ureilyticus]|uniref:H-NS family nucleoid-associated regulatory protein n=1 Tax=Variovorax ureilyticus TaxID=1836198 RepID=A0ABU8VM89_9BURK